MVESNKILTVSYGTFSCTLEGFEDSFGTMKAIAEYFRDLAADDRYFGAVPPVPDAEMLARIAEREVSRRVEARMEASGIVLRASQPMEAQVSKPVAEEPVSKPVAVEPVAAARAPVEPTAVEPVPVRADVIAPLMPPAPVVPVIMAPRLVTPRQPEPAAEFVAPRPAPVHPDADSVAAKLQRIRAVVGKGSAGFGASDDAEDSSAALSRLVADPVETFADLTFDPPATPVAPEAIAPKADVAAILAEVAAEAAAEEAAVAEEPAAIVEMVPEESGIEEVADAEDTPAAAEPVVDETYEEDAGEPVAAAPAPIRARVIKMRRADFDRAVAAGMLVEDKQDEPAAAVGTDPVADDFPDAAESFAEEEIADDAADLDDLARLDGLAALSGASTLSADDEAELLAELEAVERDAAYVSDGETVSMDDLDEDFAVEEVAEVIEDAFVDEAQPAFDVDGAIEEEVAETANDTDLALMNILARVAEPDLAPADDLAEVEAVAPAADQPIDGLADAIRAANGGVAEVEADDAETDNLFVEDEAAEDFDAVAVEADEPAEDEPAISHSHLRSEPEADEAAMSRIMSEAEAQLSEPEASRRREAIAQLRAAVAATEAARRLGEAPVETDNSAEDAFRDDLQQVVRPRRPMTPTAEVRSERPRPAPLKLVASQRVDLPREAPRSNAAAAPIRPRRVTITPEEVAVSAPMLTAVPSANRSQARSFAEFAEEMGATGLADLLEAAAAYTAYVEGSEDFSRPQLLKKVTQMAPDQFSREDGLRSFGTLLREGRIMRTRAGRFQVSEETRFNPERRAG